MGINYCNGKRASNARAPINFPAGVSQFSL
jgi:hypothetical protein